MSVRLQLLCFGFTRMAFFFEKIAGLDFFVLLQRRNGRVVDCGGLENR